MRLKHVKKGQTFILTRTGEVFTHRGMHPGDGQQVLVAPLKTNPMENETLHTLSEVELIDEPEVVQ